MDLPLLLKNIIVASHQYQVSQSEPDHTCLLKNIEELCELLSKTGDHCELFSRNIQLHKECITVLLTVIRRSRADGVAVLHGALLLLNLMAQNPFTLDVMRENGVIVQVLAEVLTETSCGSEAMTHKILETLRLLTHTKKMTREPYLQDLLLFLFKSINASKSVDVLRSSMGVLANLCRHDTLGMQMQIRTLSCSKTLGKVLVPNLSHKDQTVVIFTLAVIANLGMEDDLGRLLFHAKNLSQTMQLIFNVVVKVGSELSLSSCVDLMHDLLQHEHIHTFLASYENLAPFLLQLFKLLATCETWICIKIVQLLLTLSSVPALRLVIGQAAVRQEIAKNLLSTLLHMATAQEPQAAQHSSCSATVALHLLRDLLEYLVPGDEGQPSLSMNAETEATVQCALCCIRQALISNDMRCCVWTKVIEAVVLLRSLTLRPAVRLSGAGKEIAACAVQLLERHLKVPSFHAHARPVGLSSASSGISEDARSHEISIDIALHSLKLLSALSSDCEDIAKLLNQAMQDSQVATTFALAIMSESNARVLLALDVLSTVGTNGVCLPLLSDFLATRNGRKALEPSCSGDSCQSIPAFTDNGIVGYGTSYVHPEGASNCGTKWQSEYKEQASALDQDAGLRNLVAKMESGLEIKDLRTSEIISIFEHKLRAAQTKEEHLQDLFDAKALALAQADRLIHQYRTRMSQNEVEAQKLRSFLRDSEKRCEDGREQLNEMVLDRERLQAELERLHDNGGRLELQCSELARKLETAQRAASALRQEHDTLREMHDALQKYSENLKEQHRALEKEYQDLEEVRAKTSQQLKDKEAKLGDMIKLKHKQEETISQLNKEKADLGQLVEALQEKERQLNKKIACLNDTCKSNESAIRDKDEIIKEQRTQLDKTVQMMSLINQITSTGRLPEQQQAHAK